MIERLSGVRLGDEEMGMKAGRGLNRAYRLVGRCDSLR